MMSMSLLQLKLLFAVIFLLIAALAGWIPLKKRLASHHYQEFPAAEAFACGIFLGAALIHMLGDAASEFARAQIHYPLAYLIAGIVFLALLWLEHLSHELQHHDGGSGNSLAILAVVMLGVHSYLEGAALGLSLTVSVMLMLFLAILAHKWAAAFALAIQLNRSKLSHKKVILAFSIFALMTPLGIFSGDIVSTKLQNYALIEPIFSSLAAGTFLYLGTLHGLRRSVMIEKCCDLRQFSFVIVGFSLMAIIAIWS